MGDGRWEERGGGEFTSEAVVIRAAQSTLGRILYISAGFASIVSDTSSQSLGWRGKEAVLDLQALTAQVRKFRVRTFIVASQVVLIIRFRCRELCVLELENCERGCGAGFVWGFGSSWWLFRKIFGCRGGVQIRLDVGVKIFREQVVLPLPFFISTLARLIDQPINSCLKKCVLFIH